MLGVGKGCNVLIVVVSVGVRETMYMAGALRFSPLSAVTTLHGRLWGVSDLAVKPYRHGPSYSQHSSKAVPVADESKQIEHRVEITNQVGWCYDFFISFPN